ncbi:MULTISPECIES: tRNA (adenine(22)-N(1))-methyltransferase TrmK [Bacillaceae]|uniref:tRNA (adenine(22)-N(1))-methyltransferase n=1 Tax=Bacillaceae TaxID=186817 RepID=UPI001F36EABD|nr:MULTISPECIES: tRNA (adenine(22)-N(1))-methyltransferase TrmK [Bacillaceae]
MKKTMNVNQLSDRLAVVADYLPKGARFADIGSDHAYLPCYVCLKDESASAVAGEVNQGPFQSAVDEVQTQNLEARIDVRLGNGLEVIQPEDGIQQITIAGMGGPLIRDILEQGKDKLDSVERIITQPNIDAKALRLWYIANGYELIEEQILEENGHIYEVLVAEKGEPERPYTSNKEKELWLGPFLLSERNDAFIQKCKEEKQKKEYVLSQVKRAARFDEEKIARLQQEIDWLKEELGS